MTAVLGKVNAEDLLAMRGLGGVFLLPPFFATV
jgi:hypothetical protein